MKKVFYYLKNYTENGSHPYACVCVIKSNDGIISRGISICSKKDNFSKRIGRNKAFGFAMRGLKNENVQIVKYSKSAKKVIDAILARDFKLLIKNNQETPDIHQYLQSSTLEIPNHEKCIKGAPEGYISLTNFEKDLIES